MADIIDPLKPLPTTTTAPAGGALIMGGDAIKTGVDNLVTGAGAMKDATHYTPSDNALVSKQLTTLLSGDSPYIQRARTKAAEYSNSRGLLNSSIGAGAGEAAAIDAALPIAQGDANNYFAAERDNAATDNSFARDANSFQREGALSVNSLGAQAIEAQKGRDFTTGRDVAQREFTTAEREATQGFTVQRDAEGFKNELGRISANADANIRTYDAQNGTKLYDSYQQQSQQTYDDFAKAFTDVQQSDNDPDVKASMIKDLQTTFATRQVFINTMYSSAPKWKSEWAQFDLAF